MRKRSNRMGAPVHDAPGRGTMEVLDDALKGLVVLKGGSMGEVGEERGSVTDVDAVDSVRVDELSKNLTIGITHLFFKFKMLGSAFLGTNEAAQSLGEVQGKGH